RSVEPKAVERLLNDEDFVKNFDGNHPAFVMSVDIRKSTDLMLKAKDPELFVSFITRLCSGLGDAVFANHGVFDKFTGDGILAFFPDFYSGQDAAYLVVRAAAVCHLVFDEQYRRHRHCFNCVLKDAGLGIGIDFGSVAMVTAG